MASQEPSKECASYVELGGAALAAGLLPLWEEGSLCDLELVAGDGAVQPAHKVVLASCSGFFRAALAGAGREMREARHAGRCARVALLAHSKWCHHTSCTYNAALVCNAHLCNTALKRRVRRLPFTQASTCPRAGWSCQAWTGPACGRCCRRSTRSACAWMGATCSSCWRPAATWRWSLCG